LWLTFDENQKPWVRFGCAGINDPDRQFVLDAKNPQDRAIMHRSICYPINDEFETHESYMKWFKEIEAIAKKRCD